MIILQEPEPEQEILAPNEFGFRILINFKDGHIDTYYNVTEVHWKYKPIINGPGRVAIESDIHNTGTTYLISDIESVELEELEGLSSDFWLEN